MSSQPQLTPEQFAQLKPEPVLRTMQIIAGALLMGVISFGAVVAFQWDRQQPPPAQPQDLSNPMILIAVVFTSGAVVARFIIPSVIAKNQAAQVIIWYRTDDRAGPEEFFGRLLLIAQTRMIIEYALLEGVCFFNLIAAMQSHSPIPVGIVIGLLLMMVLMFPTRDKLLNWLEEQRNKMADL
ncbi:MAG: hypothetical protein WEB58_15260 [Planctomycetaceae bacterium]